MLTCALVDIFRVLLVCLFLAGKARVIAVAFCAMSRHNTVDPRDVESQTSSASRLGTGLSPVGQSLLIWPLRVRVRKHVGYERQNATARWTSQNATYGTVGSVWARYPAALFFSTVVHHDIILSHMEPITFVTLWRCASEMQRPGAT